jgi:hypothetical protein
MIADADQVRFSPEILGVNPTILPYAHPGSPQQPELHLMTPERDEDPVLPAPG